MNQKFPHFIRAISWSVGLSILFTLVNSGADAAWMAYLVIVASRAGLLISIPLMVLLRAARYQKGTSWWYVFVAIANTWLGMYTWVLYAARQVDIGLPWAFLPNFIGGGMMVISVFLFSGYDSDVESFKK